jgi:hypothetical protein
MRNGFGGVEDHLGARFARGAGCRRSVAVDGGDADGDVLPAGREPSIFRAAGGSP